MATVTSCTYETGAGQALAFGIPTTRHFRIIFNYWAGDQLHTGEFTSAKPVPQNTLFPITYNPTAPHENTHTKTTITLSPLLLVAIIGSILLSATWLILIRGCH